MPGGSGNYMNIETKIESCHCNGDGSLSFGER
jgi:hypothetical protein